MWDQSEENAAKQIMAFLIEGLKDPDGRVRVEELISAAAAITGERCIEAAGDFDPRNHTFIPGSRVFSDKVNQLLSTDAASQVSEVPSESVIGILRDRVVGSGYEIGDFAPLSEIYGCFAEGIGNADDWGRVPLSVPEEYRPYRLPLQVEYETRVLLDPLFSVGSDPASRLRIATLALAECLIAVAQAIDPKVALHLALETVNGMAKTAPMTDEAFQRAMSEADAP